MYNDFENFIRSNRKQLLEMWMEDMKKQEDPQIMDIASDPMYRETSEEFIDLLISNVADSDPVFMEKLENYAEKIVSLNWPVSVVIGALRVFGLLVFKKMRAGELSLQHESSDGEEDDYYRFEKWLTSMYNRVVIAYSDTWEKIVTIQKLSLQELSAPLLPLFDGISVMPLVGTIDTDRARLIMENLLTGVVKNGSVVVLIDITGVLVVDTMVAHHIIKAAEAVKLVGCQAMLVGIRPEIAQTIINLGIELDQIVTTNTMKKGMEKALALTNREIVEKKG